MQFFPGDRKLQLELLHNVAEMRIQQAMQDPSPTKMEPLVALLDKLGRCDVVCVFAHVHGATHVCALCACTPLTHQDGGLLGAPGQTWCV